MKLIQASINFVLIYLIRIDYKTNLKLYWLQKTTNNEIWQCFIQLFIIVHISEILLKCNTLTFNITEDSLLDSDEDETDTYQQLSLKTSVTDNEVETTDKRYI